jgi:hypothetical protein
MPWPAIAQALAQGKAANEAYALAGYKANDGNASRMTPRRPDLKTQSRKPGMH